MPKLGLECKLFYGTAGTQAANELKKVKDVTVNMEKGEADVTTREAEGWRLTMGTLKEATIDFDMLHESGDAAISSFQSAYMTGTPLSLFVTDGEGSGLDCDVHVLKFTRSEPLEDVVSYSVSCKPTIISGSSGRAPQWVDGGSSSSSSAASA